MATQHMWEQAVDEVVDWLYSTSDRAAEVILAGGRAPFAADLTEDEKLRYYHEKFFNPDGSDNNQGRNEVMARVGPDEWAKVYKALIKPKAERDADYAYPTIRGAYRRDDGTVDAEGLTDGGS